MAEATSCTYTGWNFVVPPPTNGRKGANAAKFANLLKKLSSGPKIMLGRRITVFSNSSLIYVSPNPLDDAYRDFEFTSAPIADTCTKDRTFFSRAIFPTSIGPLA